jgi:hypothetical protein
VNRWARRSLLALLPVVVASATTVARDRDHDGLPDGFERRWGVTDPAKRDSDRDGVVDPAEDSDGDRLGNLGERRFGTDPGDPDSDNDGRLDGKEDEDGDRRSNAREQDQRPIPAGLRPGLAQAKFDHPADKVRCTEPNTGSNARRCWFGDPGARPRIALMGDSHALMWLPAFKRSAAIEGWRLVTLIRGGCEPTLGTRNLGQYRLDGGSSCQAWRQAAVDWLGENRPDLIVITHLDSYQLVDTQGRALPRREQAKAWGAGMRRMLEALPDTSHVLLFGDAPKNHQNPVKCLKRHVSNMSACVSRRVPRSRRHVETAIREAAEAKGADHRSLYGRICTYDPCPLVHDSVLLFRDKHHLTRTFAELLTPSVRDMLQDVLAAGGSSTTGARTTTTSETGDYAGPSTIASGSDAGLTASEVGG